MGRNESREESNEPQKRDNQGKTPCNAKGRWLGTLCNGRVINPAVQQNEQKLGQGSKPNEQLPLCVIKCVIGATYPSHPWAAEALTSITALP